MKVNNKYLIENFDYFVFDLDNTLINTEKIKRAFKDQNVYKENRQMFSNSEASFEELDRVFDINNLGLDWDQVLVSGAVSFLEDLCNKGKYLMMLSIGNKNWHDYKLKKAGLEKYFKDVYFVDAGVENKIKVFEDFLEKSGADLNRVLLFNDKPEEMEVFLEKFEDIHGVLRFEKDDERYGREVYNDLVRKFNGRLEVVDEF